MEEAEEMQIASKANILSEQKFKLSYPLFQHMMYKSCQSLFEIFKKKNELTNGQLKLLAANLQEKIISKVSPFSCHLQVATSLWGLKKWRIKKKRFYLPLHMSN